MHFRLTALALIALFVVPSALAETTSPGNVLPMSTHSPKVNRLLDEAWRLGIDEVEQVKAIAVLRKVVKVDPNFALGHELLAQMSFDPAEQLSEQHKAVATKNYASVPEQTIVDWFQNAADHNLIEAITNMNEVLRQYPHDRWVVYLANRWLTRQTQYERAAEVYDHSNLTESPGLMNNMAYTYAYMRQYEKAFALMARYAASLPGNANPQDSYAEILRMAGHFDEAVEHYKVALKLDHGFYSSRFGIADTYSLMGDQAKARREYESAFRVSRVTEQEQALWRTREAITYVREGDLQSADKAFQAVADFAHTKHMSQIEADTYRQMAMYQLHSGRASSYLDRAEGALHESGGMMRAAVQQEWALVLRARVELALRKGDQGDADLTLAKLLELSNSSDDKLIQAAFHGATGAVFCARQHYKDAVRELEEDSNSPSSLRLLALAYKKIGDSSDAKRAEAALANINEPTLEQALVVPEFRECIQTRRCDSTLMKSSFPR